MLGQLSWTIKVTAIGAHGNVKGRHVKRTRTKSSVDMSVGKFYCQLMILDR